MLLFTLFTRSTLGSAYNEFSYDEHYYYDQNSCIKIIDSNVKKSLVTTSTCLQRAVSFAYFHSLETDGPNVYTKEMMFDAVHMLSVNTLSCCHGTYSLRQMQKKKQPANVHADVTVHSHQTTMTN